MTLGMIVALIVAFVAGAMIAVMLLYRALVVGLRW